MKQMLGCLDLQQIGRGHYDLNRRINLTQFNLEVYPGYQTSIRQHESNVSSHLYRCSPEKYSCHSPVRIDPRVRRGSAQNSPDRHCLRPDQSHLRQGSTLHQKGTHWLHHHHPVQSKDVPDHRHRHGFYTCLYERAAEEMNFKKFQMCISGFTASFQRRDGSSLTFADYMESRYGMRVKDMRQVRRGRVVSATTTCISCSRRGYYNVCSSQCSPASDYIHAKRQGQARRKR